MKEILVRSHALDLISLNMRKIEPRPNLKCDPWNLLKVDEEVVLHDREISITVKIEDIFITNYLDLYWEHSEDVNPYCETYNEFMEYLHYYKLSHCKKIKCFKIKVLDVSLL